MLENNTVLKGFIWEMNIHFFSAWTRPGEIRRAHSFQFNCLSVCLERQLQVNDNSQIFVCDITLYWHFLILYEGNSVTWSYAVSRLHLFMTQPTNQHSTLKHVSDIYIFLSIITLRHNTVLNIFRSLIPFSKWNSPVHSLQPMKML